MGFGAAADAPSRWKGISWGMQAIQEMLLQSWSPTPGKHDTEIFADFPGRAVALACGLVYRPSRRGRLSRQCAARKQCHHVVPRGGHESRRAADPR